MAVGLAEEPIEMMNVEEFNLGCGGNYLLVLKMVQVMKKLMESDAGEYVGGRVLIVIARFDGEHWR